MAAVICATVAFMAVSALCRASTPLERVVLATNWKAQPEHGGFYQSLADGEYERQGLQVEIRPGGPAINHRPLLATQQVDFLMGTNLLQAFSAVQQQIPTRVVAAFFQRDPQCLIAHPDQGYETWKDLTRAPLLMSNSGRQSFFLWMKKAHGFTNSQLRPYNHDLTHFLVNKTWIQQGYATAEPMRVEEAIGARPRVFLLADHGWQSYSTVIEVHDETIAKRRDVVRRFIDASILGWGRFLHGENRQAVALIKKHNPAMTDAQIEFSLTTMRALGIVDGGDAPRLGIGCMQAERIRAFHQSMVEAGLYQPGDVEPDRCFTLEFVNRGVGVGDGVGVHRAVDRE